MRRVIGTLVLGVAMGASPTIAGMLNQDARKSGPSACQMAEVNPVTGQTECITLGAPVATPSPSEAAPCQATSHSDGTWSDQPNCKSTSAH
jgi:hypothetical protein